MIRKLLVLAAVSVVASLQAVTFQWNIPNSEYSWDSAMGGNTGEYGIYFVYSQNDLGNNAANVWSAARAARNDTTSGVKVVGLNSGTTTINGANAPAYGANFAELGVVTGSQNAKTGAYLTMSGQAFGSGYYYLVVFNTDVNDEEYGKYAVSQAINYTGTVDTEKGIYNTNQNGGQPEIGDFVDIGWMGGNWTSAVVPEPTTLALLALGVAGLALRRKI